MKSLINIRRLVAIFGETVCAIFKGVLAYGTRPPVSLALTIAFAIHPTLAATPFPLGVYVGNPNGTSASAEAVFEKAYGSYSASMGVQPRYITTYVDYTQPISAWPDQNNWQAWSNAKSPDAKALIPVIGFPMASTAPGSASADAQFRAFASGQYDAQIQSIVLGWVNNGFKTFFFRPGWEMNITGPTYVGSDAQSQCDWVLAFQHIYTVIKQTARTAKADVLVIWNPNETNYSSANAINNLYPGDSYVDIIGLDMYAAIYPYADQYSPTEYHDWDTQGEDMTTTQFIADPVNRAHYWSYPAATKWSNDGSGGHALSLASLTKFALAHAKPIAIPETGAGENGSDVSDDPTFPQWLSQQLTAAVVAGGKISFVGIWDSNAGGNYAFSDSSDKKPQEAAAWKTYFGVPAKRK
jgi:hypothetical protein